MEHRRTSEKKTTLCITVSSNHKSTKVVISTNVQLQFALVWDAGGTEHAQVILLVLQGNPRQYHECRECQDLRWITKTCLSWWLTWCWFKFFPSQNFPAHLWLCQEWPYLCLTLVSLSLWSNHHQLWPCQESSLVNPNHVLVWDGCPTRCPEKQTIFRIPCIHALEACDPVHAFSNVCYCKRTCGKSRSSNFVPAGEWSSDSSS